MVEDFKSTLMEKPLVSAIMVVVGVVIGYFIAPMIKKFVKRR